MSDERSLPTMPTDERKRSVGSGNGGFGQTMRTAKRSPESCLPTMPADEMRQKRSTSDGIGDMGRGMAGGTMRERMAPSVPLKQGKRERGDRP